MLMGDFNELTCNCDPIVSNLGLTQLISFPTRGNAILDKMFTNTPAVFEEPERLSPLGSSDHCCVLLTAICDLPQETQKVTREIKPQIQELQKRRTYNDNIIFLLYGRREKREGRNARGGS